MAKWADFSGARPGVRAIKNAHIEGVLRYLSAEQPATAWKRATRNEIHSYIAGGVDVILNYEWYEGRMLEGYQAGFNDGKTAMKQAKQIGYPKGATIYFSHDTSARNDRAVLNYLRGAAKAMKGAYEVDVYSGYAVVEKALSARLARFGWQTLAWSNYRIGRAHIYQNGNSMLNRGADENIIRHRPLGSWLETIKKSPPKKASKPVKAPSKPVKTVVTYHVVTRGESLVLLASHYKTTVRQLVAWNTAKYPGVVHGINAGWKLQVTAKPAPKPIPPQKAKPILVTKVYHTVKSGETLSGIAKHYHTTVKQLQSWNEHAHPSLTRHPDEIYPTWKLRVK